VGIGSFLFVTMDCHDPELLASFWAEVLGTERDLLMDDGRYVFLKGGDDLPVICFQRVPEDKSVKNRMHLDISVDDLDAATALVEALGGSWPDGVEHRLDDSVWRTLADPEGNEFDVAVG
jgi:predicted enzyme related to lactoylglutathione lyase